MVLAGKEVAKLISLPNIPLIPICPSFKNNLRGFKVSEKHTN